MTVASLSRHAERRARQRGVPDGLIDLLLAHADVDAPAGSGCTVLRISRNRLAALRPRLGAAAERLSNLALIWSDRTAQVVTILRDHGTPAGRRYRAA